MADEVKGFSIKLNLDGEDLENDLKKIKSELKEQEKDLKSINNNLKFDATNIDAWRQKQDKLNSILNDTKAKLVNQNEQLEKAKKALEVGDISQKEYDKFRRNVEYTEAEVKKLNGEIEKTNGKIKELSNANFEKIGKLGSTLTKSLTLPIVAAATALSALTIKTAKAAEEIADTSKKLGLTAEQYQELDYACKMLGTDTQSLEKAFVKVNAMLGDIAIGKGDKAAESLALLGLTIDDLKGLNADQAFELIRNALSNVEDEALRVGIANEFFGDKLGSELIPLINEEASAINNLRNEAQELGLITNEQAEHAKEFNDKLTQLKQSFTALSAELMEIMIPILEGLVNLLKEKLLPIIQGWIDKWNGLSEGTQNMILICVGLVAAIGPVLTIVSKVGPILTAVSAALKLVGSSGFFAGAGINFATLGIGALIAIVAVALLQNEKFKEILHKLMEAFMKLLEPIMNIVTALIESLMPPIQVLIDFIVRLLDLLMPLIEIALIPMQIQFAILGRILEAVAPLLEIIGDIVGSILTPALEILFAILEPILKVLEFIFDIIEKIFDGIKNITGAIDGFVGGIGDFFGGVGDFFGDIGGNIGDFFGGVGDFFGDVGGNIGDFFDDVGDGLSDVADNVGDFFGDVGDGISDFVGGIFGKKGKANTNAASEEINTITTVLLQSDVFDNLQDLNSWGMNLKEEQNSIMNVSNNNQQNVTTNNVTINTTSPDIDIDEINRKLGGSFI